MPNPKPPPRVAKKTPPPRKPVEPPKKPTATEPPVPEQKASPDMPFVPVTQMPTSPDAVLNNLLAREMKYPTGPNEPPSKNVLLMRALSTGLTEGNLVKVKKELEQVAAHQVEKAQLIETVDLANAVDRMADWTEIIANTEKAMKRASRSGDMTTAEAVAVWHIGRAVMQECRGVVQKAKPVDSNSVVEKIDIKTQEIEETIREKWKGTSPQGREIIRKKLHAFKKKLASVEKTATGKQLMQA